MQRATQQQEQLNRGMDTFMTGGFRVLDLATKLQTEGLRFMGKRMNDYVKTSEELRQCRNPADILNVQANFVLQALSDYHAEADRIIRGFLNIQKPVQQAVETALEEYEDAILENEDQEDQDRPNRRKRNG